MLIRFLKNYFLPFQNSHDRTVLSIGAYPEICSCPASVVCISFLNTLLKFIIKRNFEYFKNVRFTDSLNSEPLNYAISSFAGGVSCCFKHAINV